MTILDFLVLKIENFGFENPYKHVLGEFGEFWKNQYFWAQKWQAGGGILPYSEILGTKFFWRPVTFPKIEIFKKIFFRPEFARETRCEIILGQFTTVVPEKGSIQKKDFVNFGVFFAHSRNGP